MVMLVQALLVKLSTVLLSTADRTQWIREATHFACEGSHKVAADSLSPTHQDPVQHFSTCFQAHSRLETGRSQQLINCQHTFSCSTNSSARYLSSGWSGACVAAACRLAMGVKVGGLAGKL